MPERESAPPSARQCAPQTPPFGELLASCAAARAVSRPPEEEPRPPRIREADPAGPADAA
ncbi:hypothetical protein GCM10023347_26050 [Streptomyces chumphonensis]|uniref:Uncharacterized protein n=1 Tax=Streptomyces chumphonensis TaxID=1214925 RepID=A0A927ICU4_9ACTN|nr:hypothetical protein [Streptomyces chumphonensis]MBD3932417.1 hypothetical protein [Streptomyces chumphonensis]